MVSQSSLYTVPSNNQWSGIWNRTSTAHSFAAQIKLLSLNPIFSHFTSLLPSRNAFSPIDAVSKTLHPLGHSILSFVGLVDIGQGRRLNTLVMDMQQPDQEQKVLVMTHGFGAGLGFFHRNYQGLSSLSGWTIYSVDWLGMGNSSRHSFPKYDTNKSDVENVQVAESFFIDALEDWRKAHDIQKMVLLGHSMGGYLSAAYTEKYPERVEKLILVSPMGVPERPKHLQPDQFPSGRKIPSFASTLWSLRFTPQALVRLLGPMGTRFVKKYTERRFDYLEEQERIHFLDYLYHISAQSGSGEFAVMTLLEGIWARNPLSSRIQHIGNGLKIPISLLYGTEDWMDYKAAVQAAQPVTHTEARVILIEDAGHQLFSDNPTAFNHALEIELMGHDIPHPPPSQVIYAHPEKTKV